MSFIKAIFILFGFAILMTPVLAGNSVSINTTGNAQNIQVTQTNGNHTAIVNVNGNSPTVIVSQSGTTNQSVELDINCGTTCPTSPYTIMQP
jgi:hypothetical protein